MHAQPKVKPMTKPKPTRRSGIRVTGDSQRRRGPLTWSSVRPIYHLWTCHWSGKITRGHRRSGDLTAAYGAGERRACKVCEPPAAIRRGLRIA
jgi:hypothetical protein